MKRNKIKKILLGALMTLPIAWVSTACQNDKNDEPGLVEGDQYVLRLNILTEVSTRSSGHQYNTGTEAESYIDFRNGDFKILLFDYASGDFIAALENYMLLSEEIGSESDSYTKSYSLVSVIKPDEEENGQLTQNVLDKPLNILILANWNKYENKSDGSSAYPSNDIFSNLTISSNPASGKTSIWKDDLNFNFTTRTHFDNPSYSSWSPSDENGYIPMYGYITGASFRKWNGLGNETAYSIPMLRALAKIEVIDKIKDNGGSDEISNVILTKYNTKGRLVPDITIQENTGWDNPTVQVSKVTVPTGTNKSSDLVFIKETKIPEGFEKEYTVYTAYISEIDLTNLDLTNDERPRLKVKVGTEDSYKDYDVHFAAYTDGKVSTPYNNLLRNHIYRYEIRSVGVTTDLILHVLDWDQVNDEIWYYEDLPGTIDPIEWTYGPNEKIKYNNDGLVYLRMTNVRQDILTGTFTIDQPLTGTWHAYLMAVGDALPNAIVFCNEDGSDLNVSENDDNYMLTHISGPICSNWDEDEKRADTIKIYIKAKDPNAKEQESRFKLLIMVQNMGNWMEVNMTKPDDDSSDNWIIVRQATDLGD